MTPSSPITSVNEKEKSSTDATHIEHADDALNKNKDEAMMPTAVPVRSDAQLMAEYVHDDEWWEAHAHAERKLVQKLDRRILPLACLLYLFAYLDRTNLGNARIQQLPEDVLHGDPTGQLFDWVNSAFFFSYILVQVPATVLARYFPAKLWIGTMAIGWGTCSTLMSTGFNFAGLIVARIGLGIFEAGFGPGIPVYMALFYTKHEMGLRMAYWFGFAAVAGAFGGLVAFGVQNAKLAIANWRLLFIIEGIPAVLLGVVTYLYLPNRIDVRSSEHFLTEEEKHLQIARMNRYSAEEAPRSVNKTHVLQAVTDWKVLTGGVMYFAFNCALASISAFLPTILSSFGFSPANSQLLTVAPYGCAAFSLVIICWLSDHFQSRGLFMAACSCVSGIGYILLVVIELHRVSVRYFAVFCIVAGTYTCIGLCIAWYTHNLGSETKKAAGVPMFMAIGQCGSVLGSHIYPLTEKPHYTKGFAISCGLQFLAMLCAISLSTYYRLENKRRDREYGKPVEGKVDTTELADNSPSFRYIP